MDVLIPKDVSPATLADFASEALLEVDEGLVVQANAAARQLLMGSPGDRSLVGLELASILEPVPLPSDKPQCLRGRRLDGADIALRALGDTGERPNHMFLRLCRDPSHDEAAESAGAGFKAAQARMELLASAMNGSSDYIVLVDRESMAHIDANEAAMAFHGIDRESLLRVPPWQIIGLDGPEQLAAAYDRIIASAPASGRGARASQAPERRRDRDVRDPAQGIAHRTGAGSSSSPAATSRSACASRPGSSGSRRRWT